MNEAGFRICAPFSKWDRHATRINEQTIRALPNWTESLEFMNELNEKRVKHIYSNLMPDWCILLCNRHFCSKFYRWTERNRHCCERFDALKVCDCDIPELIRHAIEIYRFSQLLPNAHAALALVESMAWWRGPHGPFAIYSHQTRTRNRPAYVSPNCNTFNPSVLRLHSKRDTRKWVFMVIIAAQVCDLLAKAAVRPCRAILTQQRMNSIRWGSWRAIRKLPNYNIKVRFH